MRPALRFLILTLAVTGWAVAKPPVKPAPSSYSSLWTNSPFTSKPPPEGPKEEVNLLDDYALLGVSPIGAGYRVTLINKKKPEERVTVDSDRPSKDGFKVLAVTRKAGDPLGTVVRMMSGTVTGTVSFDDKLLTVAAPPAAKPQVQPGHAQPPQPGQPQPQIQPGGPGRQPRPRVVPPPAPGGVAPQPQVPATSNVPQRQDRRGGR